MQAFVHLFRRKNHSLMHFGTSPSHFPDLVQVSVSFPSRINPSLQEIVACTIPPFSISSRDTSPFGTCGFGQDIGANGDGDGDGDCDGDRNDDRNGGSRGSLPGSEQVDQHSFHT